MPIPENVVRVSINWKLPDNEIAVNTLNFQHVHVDGNTLDWAGDMTQRYANLVKDGLESAWSVIGPFHASQAAVQSIVAYHLGTDGKTIDKAIATPTDATSLKGKGTSGMLPPELAGCISLYGYAQGAFTPNSSRKRGRIYLPGLSTGQLDANGRWGAWNQIATAYAQAFTYMHDRQMDSRPTPATQERALLCVLSRTYGLTTPVVAVSADNVYDVQRRRQNQLTPLRAYATVS